MRENEIGKCKCPLCFSTKASLRVSAKQLAYIHCDTCHVQVFARSDRSDELARNLAIKEPEPAPAPVVVRATEPPPPPPTVKAWATWGVLGSAT